MAFKDNSSFLRFVTMGAIGARAARDALNSRGHHIIELERHCCSNKIWRTKVKRLRLPDLLCTRCGRRYEVRAKTRLEIKMSHSPENPERYWDAGMIDEDTVLFVALPRGLNTNSSHINAFLVSDLRACQSIAKSGQRKSASEGAELDLTWPSWTPKESGSVVSIDLKRPRKIKVQYDSGKTYTYNAKDKLAVVQPGTQFRGGECIVASSVPSSDLGECDGDVWSPEVTAPDAASRYAALRALRHREGHQSISKLVQTITDKDTRLALEAAGTLAHVGRSEGLIALRETATADDSENAPWAMEATFILAEVGTGEALAALQHIASSAPLSEVRSASYWGLRGTQDLLSVAETGFGDTDNEVRQHAVMAVASTRLSSSDTATLIGLFERHEDVAAGACEALRWASDVDTDCLLQAAAQVTSASAWAIAALAGRTPDSVRRCQSWQASPSNLRDRLESAWFRSSSSWAASEDVQERLRSLREQHL